MSNLVPYTKSHYNGIKHYHTYTTSYRWEYEYGNAERNQLSDKYRILSPAQIEKEEQVSRTFVAAMKSLRHNPIRHQEMFTTITFASTPGLEKGIQIYNQTGRIQYTLDMDGTEQVRLFLDVVERIESLKELPDIQSMKTQRVGFGTVGALGTAFGLATTMSAAGPVGTMVGVVAGVYMGGFCGSTIAPTCGLSMKIRIGRAGRLQAKVWFLQDKAIPSYRHCKITEENLSKICSKFKSILDNFYYQMGDRHQREIYEHACSIRNTYYTKAYFPQLCNYQHPVTGLPQPAK